MNNSSTFSQLPRLACATLLIVLTILLVGPGKLLRPARASSQVHALFDLSSPTSGPFPSNVFTVVDSTQNTSLRVNLPKPDCLARPSDCKDIDLLNALDGFNLQPRLSIPFDGPIDVNSVTSQTVFLISLGSTLPDGDTRDEVVGIDQIVWDPISNTLHVEAGKLLEQHTSYALIITSGVHDSFGTPVGPEAMFERFRHELNFGQTHDQNLKTYRKALLDALKAARDHGIDEDDIVSAAVFTTQSVTAILER